MGGNKQKSPTAPVITEDLGERVWKKQPHCQGTGRQFESGFPLQIKHLQRWNKME